MNNPKPGSDEALKHGCTCPVHDNARGRGAWGTEGEDALFWVDAECPLHGVIPANDEPFDGAA